MLLSVAVEKEDISNLCTSFFVVGVVCCFSVVLFDGLII